MMRHPRDMSQAEMEAVGTASPLDALAAFGVSPVYYAFDSWLRR